MGKEDLVGKSVTITGVRYLGLKGMITAFYPAYSYENEPVYIVKFSEINSGMFVESEFVVDDDKLILDKN